MIRQKRSMPKRLAGFGIEGDEMLCAIAAEYKSARERRGTQKAVAAELGVTRETVAKRETGAKGYPISKEAERAILSIPMKP